MTAAQVAHDQAHTYPPIASYALIGDTRTVALVGLDGAVEWLCLPDVHDPSIFAAILDRLNGGCLTVGPGGAARVTRRYLDTTAVLETRFETNDGAFTVTDFLHLFPEGIDGRIEPERELIRIVEAVEGTPEVHLVYRPRPHYGARLPHIRRRGRLGWTFAHGADFHLFRTDLNVEDADGGFLRGVTRLKTGERAHVSLSFCRRDVGIIPGLGEESEAKLEATRRWWSGWASQCCYDGPFADAVVRSLVTLRMLTFSQSGAVVAAPTTSLPEAIGHGRNWDYRYCWLRDAYFTLESFIEIGYLAEAESYFDWLMHATQLTSPELQVMYDIYGRAELPEHEVGALEGYRGSSPVRVGNAAAKQLQLDVYGSVILAAVRFVEKGGTFGRLEARRLRGFGDVVRAQWNRPDNGIWEMRDRRVHHTFSKVMCWAALDGLVRLCRRGSMHADMAELETVRDEVRDTIHAHGWNRERGAFMGAFGADWLDASLLLMPALGFIDASDPRMASTFAAIDAELGRGAHMLRYAHGLDGLGGEEGAFYACGFWAVDCLARAGRVAEAHARMAELVASANDLGLLAEEYDPHTGEQLGNFPQAFSHTALVGAALALRRAEQEPS